MTLLDFPAQQTNLNFRCEFLNDYLAMVEETESPRLYHVWCAIGAVGAALGRRVYIPFGGNKIFGNHYIVLVGNPAVRKSSALSIAKRLLKDATSVRFAPDDTGGQRQGLINALTTESEDPDEVVKAVNPDSIAGITLGSDEHLDAIAGIDNMRGRMIPADVDKHVLFAASSEFSAFIGQRQDGMLDFLTQTWDGSDDFTYQTAKKDVTLEGVLLSLIGCTTPTSLSKALPKEAAGQGLLSRMILVHGDTHYKSIAWPEAPDVDLVIRVKDKLNAISRSMAGPIRIGPEVKALTSKLYEYVIETNDARFVYYQARRYFHLLKLAMCLTAMRGEMEMDVGDVQEAHSILVATERGMPDALGEFGLNPLAQVKQSIVEFLNRHRAPVELSILQSIFHRDTTQAQLLEALNDLVIAKQILQQTIVMGGQQRIVYLAKIKKKEADDKLVELLSK